MSGFDVERLRQSTPLDLVFGGLLEDAADEIERLRNFLDKLPKTADDVPVVPCMDLWQLSFRGEPIPYNRNVGMFNSDIRSAFRDCYSTREAAEAAITKADNP